MKRISLIVTLTGLFALGAYQVRAMPPQADNPQQNSTGTKAKQDAKKAGESTENAAKKAGGAVKKGSKKAANTGASPAGPAAVMRESRSSGMWRRMRPSLRSTMPSGVFSSDGSASKGQHHSVRFLRKTAIA